MENKLFFDILIYLKGHELYTEVDLFTFIDNYNQRRTVNILKTTDILPTLKELEHKKLIEYFANKTHPSGTWVSAKGDNCLISELVSFRALLKIDGYNFIENHLKENRQEKLLNESQLLTKKAMIVSIISAITAILTFVLDIKKEVGKEEEIELKLLESSQRQIDSLTQTLKNLTESHYHLLHDTVFVKYSSPIDTPKTGH